MVREKHEHENIGLIPFPNTMYAKDNNCLLDYCIGCFIEEKHINGICRNNKRGDRDKTHCKSPSRVSLLSKRVTQFLA